jgi:hypothetical protein
MQRFSHHREKRALQRDVKEKSPRINNPELTPEKLPESSVARLAGGLF